MNLDRVFVVDLESDGLLDTVTKIWCMGISWKSAKGDWKVKSTTDHENMIKIFSDPSNTLVCHNIIQYDKPLVEKILKIEMI
jgi:hypothetical protein